MLLIPAGFKVCLEPPSLEALTFSKPVRDASQELVGRRIIRKWVGFGWCVGTIVKANDDLRRTISGSHVNFFVRYEIDGEVEDLVPHVLELNAYATDDAAEYDSWLLLIEETEA